MKLDKSLISINQKIILLFFILWMRIFLRVKKRGVIKKEKLPLLIVANHVSRWDSFIILSSLGFFSMKHFWRVPTSRLYYQKFLYRIFFKTIGTYMIEPKGDMERSLEQSVNFLKQGNAIIFFPEGKIAEPDQIGMAKKGLGFLIKEVPSHIIPVYLKHPGKKNASLFLTLKNTKLIIGQPIDSLHFINNFDDHSRAQAILEEIWKLNK